ncbi:MAG: ParB/RepB/Spo0J family partition protein, partial [Planctomycetota bacterium]
MKKYRVKDIKPNPFRRLEHYPIDREKVEKLRESIRATGWWGNVMVRKAGTKCELAYGHHRWVALKEELGNNAEVEVIERKLDDSQMFQIMARENAIEWSPSAEIDHETVIAAVEGFADGRWQFEAPHSDALKRDIRYGNTFVAGEDRARDAVPAWTPATLGRFLGGMWVREDGKASTKLLNALAALEAKERLSLPDRTFAQLGVQKAGAVGK